MSFGLRSIYKDRSYIELRLAIQSDTHAVVTVRPISRNSRFSSL
jgi:hypothetical protein